ncbi:RrF2 family transcriptional regulator [Xanthobacter sp. ZOL 2024]
MGRRGAKKLSADAPRPAPKTGARCNCEWSCGNEYATRLVVPTGDAPERLRAMQLKRQSEIAINILAVCAGNPEKKFPAQLLADKVGATKDHAHQVIALLVRHGFLRSERGPGGGVRLAMDPDKIKLVDVLRITQPNLEGKPKEDPAAASPNGQALLDTIVAAASSFFVRLLDRFTIADLVAPMDADQAASVHSLLMAAPAEPPPPSPPSGAARLARGRGATRARAALSRAGTA